MSCWAVDRETFTAIVIASGSKVASEHEALLSKVELLSNLTHGERASLADELSSETFEKGQDIVVEGDDGDAFYIVSSGSAVAIKSGVGQVKAYTAGDYFGELALITSKPRAATVQAGDGGAVVLSMGVKAFKRLLGSCKELMGRDAGFYTLPGASGVGAVVTTAERTAAAAMLVDSTVWSMHENQRIGEEGDGGIPPPPRRVD